MTHAAQTLILHHYAMSPFSEKVRVILGLKSAPWRGCDQPVVMPKDELLVLTGGYRRIPVLQIGADLYFDTTRIIDEIERRFPLPSAYAGVGRGMATAVTGWTDAWAGQPGLFWTGVVALFSGDFDVAEDPVFAADRAALLGMPFDAAAMMAALPETERQLRGCLDLLERQLSDGRHFLFGSQLDIADAGAFHTINFLRYGRGRNIRILEEFPRLLAWEARVRAVGHGQRGDDISREDAIAIARAAAPAPLEHTSVHADLPSGTAIRLSYNDANTPPLDAVLLAADHQFISVRPATSQVGDLVIHMPYSTARISKR